MSERTHGACAWATSIGPRSPAAARGELVPVDEADTGLDRVDAQPPIGQVEERQPRHDAHVDPRVGEQVADAALEHVGRAGHRVDDLALLLRSFDQRVGDGLVDVGERVGLLVQVVEGSCILNDYG